MPHGPIEKSQTRENDARTRRLGIEQNGMGFRVEGSRGSPRPADPKNTAPGDQVT